MRNARGALAAAMLAAAAPAGAADFGRPLGFTVVYDGPPVVDSVTTGEGEEVVSGSYAGLVAADAGSDLGGARVDCRYVGRVLQDRTFSCGFARTERLRGYCVFTDPAGDRAVAEWSCGTAATMTPDARCEGRARFVAGTGPYGGLAGEARFHAMPLNGGEANARWTGEWELPVYALHR